MKSVVLFFPSHKFGGSVQPRNELPLGVLTVATPLDRAGYRVKIIDQRFDANWRESLSDELKNDPICVGISSMTGPQIYHGLEASRLVKKLSNVPVVWGGIHPSLMPEQTLQNETIDFVVEGEGEETFYELVKTLESKGPLNKVLGIWYKLEGKTHNAGQRPFIDLNKQPPLSYHLLDLKKYLVGVFGRGHLSFETSRGCPFRCNYCYNTKVYKSTWRSLSVEETIRRLELLAKDFGVKGVLFSDDNFFVQKERGMEILRKIKEKNLGIFTSKIDAHISSFSRFSDSELQLIRDSGCRMLMVGVESGAPRLQKMMRKELNLDDLVAFNRRLPKFDIMGLYFFMMGYPTETLDEMRKTVSLYLRLLKDNPRAVTHMNIYTPFPGTELFDISVKHGLKVPSRLEDWVSFNYRTVNENVPWLSQKQKKIIRMLHFTSILAEKNNFLNPYKKTNPITMVLAFFYYPIARFRLKNLYYQFPIEIKIAEWLGLYPKQTR